MVDGVRNAYYSSQQLADTRPHTQQREEPVMMLMDQVKKAQEQFADNATVEEVIERFESLQKELNERFEAAQNELNERFEEATDRFTDANEWVAENVTSRIASLPGAERLPQPAEIVTSYFDAIERITASNREMAIKLVSPWVLSSDSTTKVKAAAATKPAAKPTARKTTAGKTTARKTTARTTTGPRSAAKKATARKATTRKAAAPKTASSATTTSA